MTRWKGEVGGGTAMGVMGGGSVGGGPPKWPRPLPEPSLGPLYQIGPLPSVVNKN
ncbi:MAG: hypothetical protein GY820_39955 [Gammaproteobacteria bacterium]|nr:hypothetical protein [Gammaproteobacteria bacterium]